MMYADYDYYLNKYCGTLSEDSFNSLVLKASRIIDNNINTRLTQDKIDKLQKEAQEQLKYTACALTDLLNRKQESENRKINSFSIDGVTKNFNTISNEDYTNQKKEILSCLPDELTKYI